MVSKLKLKMWQLNKANRDSKNLFFTKKLFATKTSNSDKPQTEIVTKLKNSNYYILQKETQTVTKLKTHIVTSQIEIKQKTQKERN